MITWLSQHWQTVTAGAIVAVTIVIFLRRALRRRKSCGGDCGCAFKK